jgi:hypothetical protein
MRPAYTLPNGKTLRELTLWKAIVFSVLTFGIYYFVLTYQNTRDIQGARARPFGAWQVIFWLGLFIPFLTMVLWVVNVQGLNEFRQRSKMPSNSTGWIAFVFAILMGPVGAIIWAIHFNGTASALAGGNRAAGRPGATPRTA